MTATHGECSIPLMRVIPSVLSVLVLMRAATSSGGEVDPMVGKWRGFHVDAYLPPRVIAIRRTSRMPIASRIMDM